MSRTTGGAGVGVGAGAGGFETGTGGAVGAGAGAGVGVDVEGCVRGTIEEDPPVWSTAPEERPFGELAAGVTEPESGSAESVAGVSVSTGAPGSGELLWVRTEFARSVGVAVEVAEPVGPHAVAVPTSNPRTTAPRRVFVGAERRSRVGWVGTLGVSFIFVIRAI